MQNNYKVKIGNTNGDGNQIPFIAEIGVNHLGNYNRAIKMIDLAIEGGGFFKISNL